ncbi:hypothetical protein [Paucibacter soli]|uniref:hypothetical protein n=1 Tax=Paucibacter soli TaxID=3133433 RepID=UPI0030AD564A
MQREITNTYEQSQAAKQERQISSPKPQLPAVEELDLQALELVSGGAGEYVESPKNGW